jgi:hypothetical protein
MLFGHVFGCLGQEGLLETYSRYGPDRYPIPFNAVMY